MLKLAEHNLDLYKATLEEILKPMKMQKPSSNRAKD